MLPFAYGPARCEMTGPTFVDNTLIVSVQHPSEDSLFAPYPAGISPTLTRDIEMLDLDGSLFVQNRTVPRGSNWPGNVEGGAPGLPRPCVIAIQSRNSSRHFI